MLKITRTLIVLSASTLSLGLATNSHAWEYIKAEPVQAAKPACDVALIQNQALLNGSHFDPAQVVPEASVVAKADNVGTTTDAMESDGRNVANGGCVKTEVTPAAVQIYQID